MGDVSKSWFITGVSSGIGKALAAAALSAGDRVVGTVRKEEEIGNFEALASGSAKGVVLDVTDPDSVNAGVSEGVAWLGQIDVLANIAGYGLLGAVEETSDAEARAVFDTNLFGQLNVLRAALPTLRAQRAGHILAASAIGGFTGFAGLGVYSAAKAAVDILNEALAQEVEAFGIKVTVLTLGIFRTNFASSSLKETETVLEAYADTPTGKFRTFMEGLDGQQPNDPERAAQAILKLVAAENPPLHLALGQDAVDTIEKKVDKLQSDVAAWRDVSASAAFPK